MYHVDAGFKRKQIVRELLGDPVGDLLDAGCGPVTSRYPFFDSAKRITCIDPTVKPEAPRPAHVTAIRKFFLDHDFGDSKFDAIICSDMFEHIALEDEERFADRCWSLLRPDGALILSTPHAGRFAWLDPHDMKPRVQRLLHRLGLFQKLHNGVCDIRKGHKHYMTHELETAFPGFEAEEVRRFGHLYEPLAAWSEAFARRSVRLPGAGWIAPGLMRDNARDWGDEAYSIAIRFRRIEAPPVARGLPAASAAPRRVEPAWRPAAP